MLVKAVQVAIFNRVMLSQRIQLRRTKGWRMPANTLKVDRSTIFGNPFISEGRKVLEAVAMFENWLCDPHWEQTAGSAPPADHQAALGTSEGSARILGKLAWIQSGVLVQPTERGRTRSLPRGRSAETGKRVTSS